MSTIITIQVREQRPDFRGVIAHVCVAADGSPEHFAHAVREAMKQAAQNLPGAGVPSGDIGLMQAAKAVRSVPA